MLAVIHGSLDVINANALMRQSHRRRPDPASADVVCLARLASDVYSSYDQDHMLSRVE